MTVKELIALLQILPQDYDIVAWAPKGLRHTTALDVKSCTANDIDDDERFVAMRLEAFDEGKHYT